MKKYFSILIVIFFTAGGCVRTPAPQPTAIPQEPYTHVVEVGTEKIYVEIADTETEWAQGLSGRESLRDDQGMLFDFHGSTPTSLSFWMKDMTFPLDLIWINQEKIIGITKDVPEPRPGTVDKDLPQYAPPSAVTQVLEVRGGWSDKHGLGVGDVVH